MKQIGPGVLGDSEIYFSSPSLKARKLYYNVLCAGHFFCDSNYHLKRDSYNSILVLYVVDGSFTFRNHNGDFITARKNETVVLDCYEPHEYFTKDSLEFLWVHIDGVNCRDICREIINTDGNIVKTGKYRYIKELICKILDGINGNSSFTESELSVTIYKMLLEILTPASAFAKDNIQQENNIIAVKEYIGEHLNEKITVESLAKISNMSPTHFSRIFRQQTGFSPYDYVLSVRLNRAKEYLLKTDMSITQIAYETGFNSQANFIYRFSESEGVSPGRFRKTKF
ncbi:MAG: helix-turn-helix transcriptional regulator [Clostridia bacterium]|nr:helix-turn-helix transcriptional regulator [Clostridia bacterium]